MLGDSNLDYMFDPASCFFYPISLREQYISSGLLPEKVVVISKEIFHEFTSPPPPGKKIGSRAEDGAPCWIDIPPPTNSELLPADLESISAAYQEDIDALNQAYLAAVVSDGTGEPAKQQAVRDAITARKAQYAADKEAARLKYPV